MSAHDSSSPLVLRAQRRKEAQDDDLKLYVVKLIVELDVVVLATDHDEAKHVAHDNYEVSMRNGHEEPDVDDVALIEDEGDLPSEWEGCVPYPPKDFVAASGLGVVEDYVNLDGFDDDDDADDDDDDDADDDDDDDDDEAAP